MVDDELRSRANKGQDPCCAHAVVDGKCACGSNSVHEDAVHARMSWYFTGIVACTAARHRSRQQGL